MLLVLLQQSWLLLANALHAAILPLLLPLYCAAALMLADKWML
jgi:hypothetical protein